MSGADIPTHSHQLHDGQRGQVLQSFEVPDGNNQVTTFETDELTVQCPFEFGGPDFYNLTIRYVPNDEALESRSLKEYIETWRREEATAELIADVVHDHVDMTISPLKLYVCLEQARRGGIEETVEVGDRELRK
jgi:7-cyano-7-deazaguanine reductase